MPRDASNRIDRKALMGPMGQMGAALTTAGAELFGRSLEIGARRFGNILAAAIGAPAGSMDGAGWVDTMLQQYREYLGDMALTAPLAAQRFHREMRDASGDRLLICATSVRRKANADWPLLDELQHVGRDAEQELAFSAPLQQDLRDVFSAQVLAADSLEQLLEHLSGSLTGEAIDVRRASSAADTLGQALRNKQLERVPELWARLSETLAGDGTDASSLLLWREKLQKVLGEHAMRALLNQKVLPKLAQAIADKDWNISVSGALRKQLDEAFDGAGFQLSERISVVSGYRDWLICDHQHDRVFQVRREADLREVYGREEGRSYVVAGTQLRLPARVQDASQGFAVYSVSKEAVQDLLDLQQDRLLRAWDIGSRRTPLALFIVDYRESDLGSYLELGIACFAAPRKDPLAMGMHVLHLPVGDRAHAGDGRFSCVVGRKLWGYPKGEYALEFNYRDESVACILSSKKTGARLLTLTLPRGDRGSASRNIPIYSYTLKRGLHHRTVFTRSGEGETIRRGGRGVRLELSPAERDPVLDTLCGLGLPSLSPIFSSWTERMSGEFGPAQALRFPDDR
jgi:hypothetical protein